MESIVLIILGIVFIIIGIFNRKGNVSILHSYHRKRVAEEDKISFGKLVGIGMMIIGITFIVSGVLTFLATALQQNIYLIIAKVLMCVNFVIGIVIILYAMKKYNKGIF